MCKHPVHRILQLTLLCLALGALPAAAQTADQQRPSSERNEARGPTIPGPIVTPGNGLGSSLCKGGIPDDFALPTESAMPYFSNCTTNFDELIEDGKCFGHVYDCWPSECRVDRVILHIKLREGRSLASNDTISIVGSQGSGPTYWSSNLRDLGNGPIYNLHIPISFSPQLVASALAITSQDDHAIDYANLEVFYDCRARVCGHKYLDSDCDGQKDHGEAVLPGWTIVATGTGGTTTTTTTGPNGEYCFDLPAGSYSLGELAQTGWVQTAPGAPGVHLVQLGVGQVISGYDFGNRPCESCQPPARICGQKYLDRNCDGRKGSTDIPLAGWTIILTDSTGHNTSTVTATNGSYCFEGLKPGSYLIGEQAKGDDQEHHRHYLAHVVQLAPHQQEVA